MNEKNYIPGRKREIIKTILIIFLIVMLILTFCSNTIMNKSLSQVTTESAISGKLTERIRGSGIVESNQSYEVKVDDNKIIDKIMVKTGQEVKKGDVLFEVGSEESEELEDAEATLIALELEYQKALLNTPEDYTMENQAINNAREDLNAAIAKRNNAVANSNAEQQALYDYNSNQSELTRKTKILEKLQATIIALDSNDYASASVEYIGNLIFLYDAYCNAEEDYDNTYNLYIQMLTSKPSEPSTESPETSEENTVINTEEPDNSVEFPENNNIEVLKDEVDAKKITLDNALNEYNSSKSDIRNDLMNQLYVIENDIDSLNEQISNYESSKGNDTTMSIEEYDEDIRLKQNTLEELIAELNKTKNKDDIENKTVLLEIEAKKKEIENMEKKIEKLKAESSITEISSEYDGIVSSINVKLGEQTVPDVAIAVIDIAEEGYTVTLTVDAEKTKKIKEGIEAEVVNNWNGDITAILTDIRNDTVANSKNKILEFSVTGDVSTGTMIDLSIPCGTGNYDTIVPKSAVYKDSQGYFVLTVSSKSSPLGNRYYTDRIDVEVLASDEVSSAIQGNISAGTYIITTASKPVQANEQVRIKDN